MAEIDFSSMTEVEFCQHMLMKLRTALATQSGYSSAKMSTASGANSEYVNWSPAQLRDELRIWENKLTQAQEKEAGTITPRIKILKYERTN